MNAIRAVVRNGRLETDEPINLPEGTELLIPLPNGDSAQEDSEEVWDDSPEGIEAWLRWCDTLQPLIFTEEERAALEADRRARKEWEKAHFDQYADEVRRLWE
jgi:hypothetical protein